MIGIYRYNGRFFTTRPSRIELAQGGLKEEPSVSKLAEYWVTP